MEFLDDRRGRPRFKPAAQESVLVTLAAPGRAPLSGRLTNGSMESLGVFLPGVSEVPPAGLAVSARLRDLPDHPLSCEVARARVVADGVHLGLQLVPPADAQQARRQESLACMLAGPHRDRVVEWAARFLK